MDNTALISSMTGGRNPEKLQLDPSIVNFLANYGKGPAAAPGGNMTLQPIANPTATTQAEFLANLSLPGMDDGPLVNAALPGGADTSGGRGPTGKSIMGALTSPEGRNVLSMLSALGLVVSNPLSMAAGVANGMLGWGNMNNLDKSRSAYGRDTLTAGQRVGGVMGVNSYGRDSVVSDFNKSMAKDITAGRQVTVPNVNAPTSRGGLNPGERATDEVYNPMLDDFAVNGGFGPGSVGPGGGFGADGGGSVGADANGQSGVSIASLGDMGYDVSSIL
jgi:hypothetical protein